jgi:hypothetical protein
MKKTLIILALTSILAGCATDGITPVPAVAVHYKYIVNTIPAAMLVLPDAVPPLNLATATDKELADWIIESEKRNQAEESQLKAIKAYQDDKLKNLQVPAADVIKD